MRFAECEGRGEGVGRGKRGEGGDCLRCRRRGWTVAAARIRKRVSACYQLNNNIANPYRSHAGNLLPQWLLAVVLFPNLNPKPRSGRAPSLVKMHYDLEELGFESLPLKAYHAAWPFKR